MASMRISEAFRSDEPPPMRPYEGHITIPTAHHYMAAFPKAIKRLKTQDFNDEINSWIDNKIVNTDLDHVIELRRFEEDHLSCPGSEKEIEWHVDTHILRPCNHIINPSICPGFVLNRFPCTSSAHYCLRGLRRSCENEEEEQERLFIEVKTPINLTLAEHIPFIIKERDDLNDLVQTYKSARVDPNFYECNASKMIREIWMHFQDSGCSYGILTNGMCSIFIRRTSSEPEVLIISEPFSNYALEDSLSILARYCYFAWKAHDTAPIPFIRQKRLPSASPLHDTPEDVDNSRGSHHRVPSLLLDHRRRRRRGDSDRRPRRYSKRLRSKAAHEATYFPSAATNAFTSSLKKRPSRRLDKQYPFHKGNYALVRHADWGGHKVIVKRCLESVEDNRIVLHEGENYNKLKQLQGKAIPRIFDHFIGEFTMYHLVMEKLLPIKKWTPEIVDKACASLTALHELGYVHRDISRSNFMQNRNGDVFVIDLEHAKWKPNVDGTCTGEHDQVKEFLRFQ